MVKIFRFSLLFPDSLMNSAFFSVFCSVFFTLLERTGHKLFPESFYEPGTCTLVPMKIIRNTKGLTDTWIKL